VDCDCLKDETHSAHVLSSESVDEWHGAGQLDEACTVHTGSFQVCCSCPHPYSQHVARHYTHQSINQSINHAAGDAPCQFWKNESQAWTPFV